MKNEDQFLQTLKVQINGDTAKYVFLKYLFSLILMLIIRAVYYKQSLRIK